MLTKHRDRARHDIYVVSFLFPRCPRVDSFGPMALVFVILGGFWSFSKSFFCHYLLELGETHSPRFFSPY